MNGEGNQAATTMRGRKRSRRSPVGDEGAPWGLARFLLIVLPERRVGGYGRRGGCWRRGVRVGGRGGSSVWAERVGTRCCRPLDELRRELSCRSRRDGRREGQANQLAITRHPARLTPEILNVRKGRKGDEVRLGGSRRPWWQAAAGERQEGTQLAASEVCVRICGFSLRFHALARLC